MHMIMIVHDDERYAYYWNIPMVCKNCDIQEKWVEKQ